MWILFSAIGLLVLLIVWAKWRPLLAFLTVSIAAAAALGIPCKAIPGVLEKGVGGTLGAAAPVLFLGAMFGKLIAESGAAQQISGTLMRQFGAGRIHWAFMLTGFIVGIPLFYNAGFVLLVPLVLALSQQYRLPAIFLGIPLLAALSVTHGFLPPHPSPVALIPQFGADTGRTLLYGLLVAVPAAMVAGPVFAGFLKKIPSVPTALFQAQTLPTAALPSPALSFGMALLPVFLISGAALAPVVFPGQTDIANVAALLGDATVAMLLSLLIATYTLGLKGGRSVAQVMEMYSESVKEIAEIVLIIAGAGALKQVLVESGVSGQLAQMFQHLSVHPLVLAWLTATVIRICVGSATVAGLTAAGITAPMAVSGQADPNLMVLAIGAGSLMCSHVNDSGFWMCKTYFNLSLRDTFRTWTMMETIVGIVGLAGVLLLDLIY